MNTVISKLSRGELSFGPDTIYVSKELFRGNQSVRKVNMPASLQIIKKDAFNGCENLRTVSLHYGLKEIRTRAFCFTPKLTAIEFPESLTRIGHDSFWGSGLKEIRIPGSVKDIEPYTFAECRSLKRVILEPGVERISYRAFWECEALEHVLFRSSVKIICEEAFAECVSLKTVSLPRGCEVMENAFPPTCKVEHLSPEMMALEPFKWVFQ